MEPQELEQDVMVYLAWERLPAQFHRTKKDQAALWVDVPEASKKVTLEFNISEERTVNTFLAFLQDVCEFEVKKEVTKDKVSVTLQEYNNSNSYIQ